MVTQRRRFLRWPAYAIVGAMVLGLTALTASAAVRASAAQWLLDVTDVGSEAPTDDAPSTGAGDGGEEQDGNAREQARRGLDANDAALIDPQRDVAACERIGAAARLYGDGELTLRGYLAELEHVAGAAAQGGDVERYASASLEAITARDADAEEQARNGLAEACAVASTLAD